MKTLVKPLVILCLMAPLQILAADEAKEEDNPVLVSVNGVDISKDQLAHFMSKNPSVKTPQQAINEMINVELLNQAARNAGILKNKAVQLEIERSTSAIVAASYLQDFLGKLDISEEAIGARYQKDYVENSQTKEYNANHILVNTEQEARNIILRLDKGESFEELAQKLSTGPSGKKGGSLGWFKKPDMVAPFSEATAKLEKGAYSESPVQTRFGWHVIRLNDVRSSAPPSVESVSRKIQTEIAGESMQSRLKELHDAATIEFK